MGTAHIAVTDQVGNVADVAVPVTLATTGFVVGTGASAMTFPEKPGLLGTEDLPTWEGPWWFDRGVTVIDGYRIDGRLELREGDPTVIIKNCIISVDGWYGILAELGHLEIEHCLFDGAGVQIPSFPCVISGGHVRFCEFRHNTDNIRLGGSNVVAEWNWIHSAKPGSSELAHSDGIEIYDASRPPGHVGPHIIVRNNYIDIAGGAGETGCVNITTDFGETDGVRVEGNTFMPGGTYSLYVRLQTTSGPIRNIEIVNNRWFADAGHPDGGFYGSHSVDPESAISAWSGNTLRNIDGSNLRPNPL